MCVCDDLYEILCRWQKQDIRQRDGSALVWDIGGPGLFARHRRKRRDAVAACRRELLTTMLRRDHPVFLMAPESPQEWEIPGQWQTVGEMTWLLPPDFEPDHPAVQRWLFQTGGWRLYQAAAPDAGISPDVFRCRAAELLAYMNTHAVQALIESFHDDTDWVVALSTPPRQDDTMHGSPCRALDN
jgi:hypothetical protein